MLIYQGRWERAAAGQFDPAVTEALLKLDFDALDEGAASVHG
jgi:hypothetical protein